MLDDILVVDLSRALAGPYAAMMLGDLGARVTPRSAVSRRRQSMSASLLLARGRSAVCSRRRRRTDHPRYRARLGA